MARDEFPSQCAGFIDIDHTQVVRMARPSSRAQTCRWMTPPMTPPGVCTPR